MSKVRARIALLITMVAVFTAFSQYNNDGYRVMKNPSFKKGELLEYKINLGFLSAGEATMSILPEIERVNDRPCYRIDIFGKTVGLADMLYSVKDNWGTYYDTASLVPHKFYRNIQEGGYRKYEVIEFDHENEQARVTVYDKKTFKPRDVASYEIPPHIQDLVSGYYFIRTLDFRTIQPNDTFSVKAFFDKELYDFKIVFLRREVVKTKLGKINSMVFTPVMPKNSIFDGENAIQLWMSDDDNRIPLKVKAKMFLVGSVELDIIKATNIKSELSIAN